MRGEGLRDVRTAGVNIGGGWREGGGVRVTVGSGLSVSGGGGEWGTAIGHVALDAGLTIANHDGRGETVVRGTSWKCNAIVDEGSLYVVDVVGRHQSTAC